MGGGGAVVCHPCLTSNYRTLGLAPCLALLPRLLGNHRGGKFEDRAVSLVAGTHFSGGDALVFLARCKTPVLQCVGLFPLAVAHISFTDLAPVPPSSSSSSSAAQPPTALACHPGRP